MPITTDKRPKFKKQVEESLTRRCANYTRRMYPHLIFFADASGVKMSDSKRISMTAMKSKGFRVPDKIILYASRGYHGACFELKKEGTVIYNKDGTLRKQSYKKVYKKYGKEWVVSGDHLAEQADSLRRLNEAGYFARFVVGFDDYVKKLDWYMENENAELF